MGKMVSIFREEQWVLHRHMLNPCKLKEHPLHCVGLGFLNKINFIPEYTERFTHIDPLTNEALSRLHFFTRLYVQRRTISADKTEQSLLRKHHFRTDKTWATLLIDLNNPLEFNRMINRNVKKGEEELIFQEADDGFREYYNLMVINRAQENMKTPSFKEYSKVRRNKFYHVFIVRDKQHKLVGGMGLVNNSEYACEFNLARDKSIPFVQDYLKYKVLEHLKAKGVRWYDLAGVNPNPQPNTKDFFIRQYKEKWGGELQNVYEYVRGFEIKLSNTDDLHKKILKLVKPVGKIADIGCGKKKIVPNAIGYDIIDGVDKQIHILNVQEKNEYDTIYCIGMLYLMEKGKDREAMEILKCMLKSGGNLLITVANPNALLKSRVEYGENPLTKKEFNEAFPGCRFTTLMWGGYLVCMWRKP